MFLASTYNVLSYSFLHGIHTHPRLDPHFNLAQGGDQWPERVGQADTEDEHVRIDHKSLKKKGENETNMVAKGSILGLEGSPTEL